MSTKQNARFQVVGEDYEEEQQRSLTFDMFLEQFFARLDRLQVARETIENQLARNTEAHTRLREEGLQRAASAQANDGIIRLLIPDETDPLVKLIDAAMDFLYQLREVAEQHPAIQGDLASMLAISPVVIRSALAGITWPLDEKIAQLTDLAQNQDKPNNIQEEDRNEKYNHNNGGDIA